MRCHNKNLQNNQNQDSSYPTSLGSMEEPQEMAKPKVGAIGEREPKLALKTRPPGLSHVTGQAPSRLTHRTSSLTGVGWGRWEG